MAQQQEKAKRRDFKVVNLTLNYCVSSNVSLLASENL